MSLLDLFQKDKQTVIVISAIVVSIILLLIVYKYKENYDLVEYDKINRAYGGVIANVDIIYNPTLIKEDQLAMLPFAMLIAVSNIQIALRKRAVINPTGIDPLDSIIPSGYSGIVKIDNELIPFGKVGKNAAVELVNVYTKIPASMLASIPLSDRERNSLPNIRFIIDTENIDTNTLIGNLAVAVNNIQTSMGGQVVFSGNPASFGASIKIPDGFTGALYVANLHSEPVTIPFGPNSSNFDSDLRNVYMLLA